jgi:hypothetical protein
MLPLLLLLLLLLLAPPSLASSGVLGVILPFGPFAPFRARRKHDLYNRERAAGDSQPLGTLLQAASEHDDQPPPEGVGDGGAHRGAHLREGPQHRTDHGARA